ncbi:ABC transporter permease subunit [Cellulomonas timonensis]|uniref:ABC transporter permease subunit n=1 Tax=Cellulomonas timonensis TaxID=1689271 RepID=UPI0009ED8054
MTVQARPAGGAGVADLEVRFTHQGDPLVRPLLAELAQEYADRYERSQQEMADDLAQYPAEEFAGPGGALVLLLVDGEPVAGGAFRRYDDTTAELKRIWTRSDQRRRGLARRVLDVLEREIAARGYTRVYLTTGPRQPEARALYLATGYTPLFDVDADPQPRPLPFEKHLPHGANDLARAVPQEEDADAAARIIPARHVGRWVATAGTFVLLAMVISSLTTNARWEWSIVWQYLTWPSVLNGLWGTVRLTLTAAMIGFGLGTVLALMRLSPSPLLRSVSWTYTWVFRSVPLILQLLLWYNLAYLYPTLSLGIPFGPEFLQFGTLDVIDKFGAAVLGLGLSQAAYSAEIVRAGILSVDQGQHEAAAALGLPRRRQQRRIILPQAMRTIVPTAVNEIIGLVKGTSVVYVLAYGELFYIVGVIYGRNQRVVPLLLVAGIWYLVLTTFITVVQYYVERHYAKGALRTLPPTPLQHARWTVGVAWTRLTGRPLPTGVPPSYLARSSLASNVLTRTRARGTAGADGGRL